MKQPSKKYLKRLKEESSDASNWEEVDSFQATRPTSIRLPSTLIQDLEAIAKLRGERSYQTLLKKWLIERTKYEKELVDLARKRKAG